MPATSAEERDRWIAVAERFAREVLAPSAEEADRTDRLPGSVRSALAETGLMGLTMPRELGGAGAGARTLAPVLETLARESAAAATLLSVHLSVASTPIVQHGTPEQRRSLVPRLASGEWLGAFALSEPSVGSDAGALATRYRRTGSGFVLSGSKMFITSAASAELTVLFATRDPALGHRGISAFVVPKGTPGVSVGPRLDKLGIRGSETVELVLDGAELSLDSLLGTEGEGLAIALEGLAGGRVGIAACALGVARAAFEEMRRSARREPADWKRAAVARAFTDVEAAAALVARAAELRDRDEPFVDAASAAKLFASGAAVRIALAGIDVAGPDGVRAGARSERLLRDARVFPIVEGTTEIQEMILGRDLVGR